MKDKEFSNCNLGCVGVEFGSDFGNDRIGGETSYTGGIEVRGKPSMTVLPLVSMMMVVCRAVCLGTSTNDCQ